MNMSFENQGAMEGREEKTQETNVTTQSSSSKSCSSHADLIPFDLTWEIVLRLPSKSLMRFQCVSKLWSSIPLEPNFISSFTTRSAVQRSCLLLHFEKNDEQIFFSLSQQKKNFEMCVPHVEKYHLGNQKKRRYSPMFQFQSVHGLISFHYLHHSEIWNPSMGQYVTKFPKPKPGEPAYRFSYLGYDPIGNTYKLLSMSCTSTDEAFVLTLGTKASWRRIKNIPKRSDCKGICINRVLYLIVSMRREIMSFDVRSEKVKLIQTCSSVHKSVKTDLSLVSYKGKLAWVIMELSFYKLWVLEDVEKEEWSCQNFQIPFSPNDHIANVSYHLSSVTDEGEFIYVSVSWKDKEIYVCYYNPLRNSNMSVKIGTFEDDNFWHGDWRFIGSLPNHIENLASLKNFTYSSPV